MTDLALTPQRRAELVALLGDEPRLRTEFPRVADYLDTASRLPGTGDERADAAFDLRLVHHLTGDSSANPYWDIVGPSVSTVAGRRVVDGGRATGSTRLGFAQTILQSAYAYAIPAPETIAWITTLCAGRPLTEIGAGRGYWAAQPPAANTTPCSCAGPPAGAITWPPRLSPTSRPPAAPTSSTWANPEAAERPTPPSSTPSPPPGTWIPKTPTTSHGGTSPTPPNPGPAPDPPLRDRSLMLFP
ncbi:hypothetical protein [Nocardia sp. NPDC059239]|uniref:hypothetical protein n=1 Tax=Nocardia sp. NPDC059239 TaxID=3346785 RepID=UPI003673F5C1